MSDVLGLVWVNTEWFVHTNNFFILESAQRADCIYMCPTVDPSLAGYISHCGAEPWLGSGVILLRLSRKAQWVLTA